MVFAEKLQMLTFLVAKLPIATFVVAFSCWITQPAHAESVKIAAQGRLSATNGGPVADGTFALSVGLYPQSQGGNSLFEEPFLAVPVTGGVFAVVLGASKYPLDSAAFANGGPLWVSVTVGADELPRVALTQTPFAVYALIAKSAADLQCSGCIGEADLAKGAVTSDKIATGAVGANHVSFNWAAADVPGGVATYAIGANTAKLAEQAKTAEVATYADESGAAKSLACTGCIKTAAVADGAITLAKLAPNALDWKNIVNMPSGFTDGVDNALSEADLLQTLAKAPADLAVGAKIGGIAAARIASVANTALEVGNFVVLDTGAKHPGVLAQAWYYETSSSTWILANSGQSGGFGSCTDCGNGSDGAYNPQTNTTLDTAKKYQFTDFIIPKGVVVTATGANALEIKASKKIQIDGTLILDGGIAVTSTSGNNGCSSTNATSTPGAAGPGGFAGASTTYGNLTAVNGPGPGGGGGAGNPNGSGYGNGGGGGGAGYGTAGGNGANAGVSSTSQPGGIGGLTYAGISGGTLQGGSGGGAGGYGSAQNSGGAGGGGGGGALKLDAPEITISGKISANGGNGGGMVLCDGGGGGGGSGGAIWLRGGKVDFGGGTLSAIGGAGGSIDLASGADGGPGGLGGAGKIRIDSPGAVVGTSNPSFFKGDTAGLGSISGSAFAIEQTSLGVVRLTNLSGTKTNVVLVATF